MKQKTKFITIFNTKVVISIGERRVFDLFNLEDKVKINSIAQINAINPKQH